MVGVPERFAIWLIMDNLNAKSTQNCFRSVDYTYFDNTIMLIWLKSVGLSLNGICTTHRGIYTHADECPSPAVAAPQVQQLFYI